jgi:hypothetical protein
MFPPCPPWGRMELATPSGFVWGRALANEAERVNCHSAHPRFVMQMRAGRVTSRADLADNLALLDVLRWEHVQARQMAISGANPAGMFNFDQIAVTARPAGDSDYSRSTGHHGCAVPAGQIHTRMSTAGPSDRVGSPTETRGDPKPVERGRLTRGRRVPGQQRRRLRRRIPIEHVAAKFVARARRQRSGLYRIWNRDGGQGNCRDIGANPQSSPGTHCEHHDLSVSSMTSPDQPVDQMVVALWLPSNRSREFHANTVKMVGGSHFRTVTTALISCAMNLLRVVRPICNRQVILCNQLACDAFRRNNN